MSDTKAVKNKRERSKAYPGASLEACVSYVTQIKKNLGKGVHDRDSLAQAMGFEKANGAVNPKVAALVHFGFLDRAEGGYQLSASSGKITDAINEEERKEELRVAFARPTLYQELLEKFSQERQIPVQLATHLHRFHGITDSASNQAAEIFVASGRFAGVLDIENRIIASGDSQGAGAAKTDLRDETKAEIAKVQQSPGDPTEAARPNDNAKAPLPVTAAGTQRFEFSITGGRAAALTVPSVLNAKDIRIIRKQIELLELQAGIDESEPSS
jgi:hypothetical protein